MHMTRSLTSYDILNVSEKASQNEIHTAYRALAKTWHPDANRGRGSVQAHHNFKILQQAYANIKTPQARSDYNQKLARLRRAVRISQNAAMNDNSRLYGFMNFLDNLFYLNNRKGV
jgi:DnaJ-class molecular chaperone